MCWAHTKKQGFQLITETLVLFGAEGRTRTDTISLPLDFESSASASFTTSAYCLIIITYTLKQINTFFKIFFGNLHYKKF